MTATVTVGEGTNLRLDQGLEVGAGNFWEEDYLDEAKQPRRGLTAGLFFLVRDEAGPRQQPLRVHPGLELTAGKSRFRVEDVKRVRGKGVVVLLVLS